MIRVKAFKNSLFKPVLAANLGLFRILWGFVMLYYFLTLSLGGGEVKYVNTVFQFKYPFFEWVEILSDNLLFLCFYSGVFFSLFMILGLYYKTASKTLFILFTYIFFIDVTYWNNHYYAYILISAFFVVTDAHKAFSLDKKRLNLDNYIPKWQLFLFQFQIVLIYVFGGFSKMQNKDWMVNSTGYALVLQNLKLKHDTVYPISLFLTYGGLLYDLIIGFLLLNKKWIWYLFPIILLFNLSNSYLFNIGTFPYAMIASFVLFIPAKTIWKWLRKKEIIDELEPKFKTSYSAKQTTFVFLMLFVVFQILFPFRSLCIDGSVFWTSEGKLYAWHMMSSVSYIDANKFIIAEYTNDDFLIKETPLDASKFLSKKQIRRMATFPFLIPQFAKFLKKEAELAGLKNVKVFANIEVSKNYRPKKAIVSPNIDLSAVKVNYFKHNDWILRYDKEDGFFNKH